MFKCKIYLPVAKLLQVVGPGSSTLVVVPLADVIVSEQPCALVVQDEPWYSEGQWCHRFQAPPSDAHKRRWDESKTNRLTDKHSYQGIFLVRFSKTEFLYFSPDCLGKLEVAATVPNVRKHEQECLHKCQFKVRADKAE